MVVVVGERSWDLAMMCGVLLCARGRGARNRRTKKAGEVVTIYTAEGQSCAAGHEEGKTHRRRRGRLDVLMMDEVVWSWIEINVVVAVVQGSTRCRGWRSLVDS